MSPQTWTQLQLRNRSFKFEGGVELHDKSELNLKQGDNLKADSY